VTDLARRIYDTAHISGQFTLRSGASSTEYFDKYLFESDPVLLRDVAAALAERLSDVLGPPRGPAGGVQAVAGLELGGVPIAVALSNVTGLPTLFVRKQAKTYGTCKLAEGGRVSGRRLLVAEDVVTSGGQVLASVEDLRQRGAIVDVVACVIDRESGGRQALAAAGLELRALFTMSELKETAA